MPGIVSGVLITFIPSVGAYLTPDLLGGPSSQMIANIIERQFKTANDWPFGAALSFLLDVHDLRGHGRAGASGSRDAGARRHERRREPLAPARRRWNTCAAGRSAPGWRSWPSSSTRR